MNARLHFLLFSLVIPGEILVGFSYVQVYKWDTVTGRKEGKKYLGGVLAIMVLYHHVSYRGAVVHVNLPVALAL